MQIFRATKGNVLTQGFGKENTKPALLSIYEASGCIGHDGWDWAIRCSISNTVKTGGGGESVYCDLGGNAEITYIQRDQSRGCGIIAVDDEGFKHLWWHFDTINPALKVGSIIESADFLGIGGNTGTSTGAHLHRGLYKYGEEGNGYNGAIDMTPYFDNRFIVHNIMEKFV